MKLKNLPRPSSKCPVCGINQYPPENKPLQWPCNVGLFRELNRKKEEQGVCPYETVEQQKDALIVSSEDVIAGLLGTQSGD